MPNTSRKGNVGERFVTRWLEERGWVVASRRHIGGSGDLLAVLPENGRVMLIEVKHCKQKQLWQNFRREDREEMRKTKLPEGSERYVVNKVGEELVWLSEKCWP